MNFTREPIIETVISPKEGHKLIVRNSKGGNQEEYVVDAVEVVSFGHSFFFRSLERSKAFLVPVSDYEVVETKETRVVLKNASFGGSIKIGGGKEASVKGQKTKEQEPAAIEQRLDKKRERRRHRKKTPHPPPAEKKEEPKPADEKPEGGGAGDEAKVSSSILRRLIPPPPGLISDKIAREKTPDKTKGDVLPDETVVEDKPKRTRRKKKEPSEENPLEEDSSSDEKPSGEKEPDIERTAIEMQESTSTSFSSIEERSYFSPFEKNW